MRALNPHSIPFEILYPTIYTVCTYKRTEIRDKEKYYEWKSDGE